MGLVDDDSLFDQDGAMEDRIAELEKLGIKGRPLERCIDRLGIEISNRNGSVEEQVAKKVSGEEFG